MRKFTLCACYCLLALLSAAGAQAAVIDFNSLPGPNNVPFLGLTEEGFEVTPLVGDWRQGVFFGNPVPSIFARDEEASIEVTGPALFQFTSLDLADARSTQGPTASYSIEGFLGAVSVFSFGGVTSLGGFSTIANPDPSVLIDTLVITLQRGQFSYNIDNIVVDAAGSVVPEPGSMLLISTALAGVVFLRRR